MADIIDFKAKDEERWDAKELMKNASEYVDDMENVIIIYYDTEGVLKYGACNMSPKDLLYALEAIKLSIFQE